MPKRRPPTAPDLARPDRLAAALRANLSRRKAQSSARRAPGGEVSAQNTGGSSPTRPPSPSVKD